MPRRLFFFDLDGTLLTSEKTISPATYAALEAWHAAGHALAISSGRPLRSVLDAIRENGLARFSPYAIAFNGCQIYDCAAERSLVKKTLSLPQVALIRAHAERMGIHWHAYDDQHILSPREDEELAYYTRVVRLPVRVLSDTIQITEPPCKLLCIDLAGPERIERLGECIREDRSLGQGRLGDHVTAMRSNPYYLEVFPADAGKGAAVTELADLLSIPREATYAAGDEQNDISMLTAAGTGVAMCSGNPETIAAADVVTETDNDHDGLAPLLRAFL